MRRSFNARPAWPRILLPGLLLQASNALAADWTPAGESQRQDIGADLAYAKRAAVRPWDGKPVTAHLAFFTSRAFRLGVIDLGAGPNRHTRHWSPPFAARAAWPGSTAGGSSTGFFFGRGADRALVTLQPWERVRNLFGICPR